MNDDLKHSIKTNLLGCGIIGTLVGPFSLMVAGGIYLTVREHNAEQQLDAEQTYILASIEDCERQGLSNTFCAQTQERARELYQTLTSFSTPAEEKYRDYSDCTRGNRACVGKEEMVTHRTRFRHDTYPAMRYRPIYAGWQTTADGETALPLFESTEDGYLWRQGSSLIKAPDANL